MVKTPIYRDMYISIWKSLFLPFGLSVLVSAFSSSSSFEVDMRYISVEEKGACILSVV